MSYLNWIKTQMQINWRVKRICGNFAVSREFAKLYIQPCHKPEDVAEIMACRKVCLSNSFE